MKQMLVPLLLLTAAALAACGALQTAPAEAPVFAITTTKPEDTVTPVVQSGPLRGAEARFDVRSASGIGGAQVKLTAGAWPETVRLRFYMRSLEEMRFQYGETTILVAVPLAAEGQVRESVVTATGVEEPLTSNDPRWMPVDVKTSATSAVDYIEVMAPEAFIQGGFDGFAVQWIDFYR